MNMSGIYVPATIPLDELAEITDNFDVKCVIGEGPNGKVYHGVLKNGRPAAIKKLDTRNQAEQIISAQVGLNTVHINIPACIIV